jgi:hypothetical protein
MGVRKICRWFGIFPMEKIDGEQLVYKQYKMLVSHRGQVLPSFFISHRSVGKGENTSTIVGHCIL